MSPEPPSKGDQQSLRIGPYQVVKRVGAGAMGVVYKALHVDLGREVALKILPFEIAAKPGMLERFRREAQHASKLRYKHIVTLYESGEAEGTHFLAMEFVEGKNLLEYIREKGPLDPAEAERFLRHAAKALAVAHKHGIVHRDIKPSNFLIAHKNGRPCVKLTDFGLARTMEEDGDFQLTRIGSTVGTVDYMAPEQARSSRSADIRSDIYSLGCTLFHMLTGRPPFPDGDYTERIFKHIETEPPDVRDFNPQVPASLVAVLRRMLEKKPEDRYQTPRELLRDLEEVARGSRLRSLELLKGLALGSGEAPKPARRPRPGSRSADIAEQTASPAAPRQRNSVPAPYPPQINERGSRREKRGSSSSIKIRPVRLGWKLWGAVLGGVVAVSLITLAITLEWGGQPAPDMQVTTSTEPPEKLIQRPVEPHRVHDPDPLVKTEPEPPARPGTGSTKKVETAAHEERLPQIYQAPPEILAELQRQFRSPPPLAKPASSGTPAYVVSRFHAGNGGPHFDSLAAACAAALPDRETIIEIHDNGPLFELPVVASGRSLLVRAGNGYRPLIAWNGQGHGAGKSFRFLTVEHGNLTLENLDLVVKCSDSDPEELACLVRVGAGDVAAEGCTFSVAGRHRNGVAVFQLDSTRATDGGGSCRLSRCYLRGADMIALDLRRPAIEMTMDGCLVVGGNQPLVDIVGKSTAVPTIVRVARSTLVAGQTLIRVRPATAGDRQPAVHWLGWDSVLARFGTPSGGGMVDLQEGAGISGMQWRAVNCLYLGWQSLLKSAVPGLAQSDLAGWRSLWNQSEGEAVVMPTWPSAVPPDSSETSPAAFRAAGTPAGFAATSGPGAIGCDVRLLPPSRENWLSWTYDRFASPPVEVPSADKAPEIPQLADGRYHGERLDLLQVNLGEHLQNVQEKFQLGPKVVLHLCGQGEVRTSPIHMEGASLVLYFEPPQEGADPLVLVPKGGAGREAFIEVEGGSCEVVGGAITFPNSKNVPLPACVFKVRGGDLRLAGCQVQGALGQAPASYRSLIHFEGSGQPAADRARECVLADSILLSGKTCVHSVGTGARVYLQNCVAVAGTDAFHFDPAREMGSDPLCLNTQYILDHNTIAAKGAVIRLSDVELSAAPSEPMIVQARGNVFLVPFTGPAHRCALLAVESNALAHGLMVWQGDANGYDKELQYYIASGQAPIPASKQPYSAWTSLWGPFADRRPLTLELPSRLRTLDLDRPQLDRLALPQSVRQKLKGMALGADLEQLGIVKPPMKKPSPP